jgi:predicted dehydrogenase
MLRTLIVGCGNIAGGFDAQRPVHALPLTHAGAYRAHSGFELAACVEPDEQKRLAFMQRWGIARGYAGLAQLVAAGERFDVISLCSPTPVHHADAVAALALQPRLLFCEKPICPALAEAEDLVRRCHAAGVLLAVNHNRRWDPDIARLAGELAAGRWGKLRSATGWYDKGVLNNGSHLIDLLNALVGPMELRHAGAPEYDFWEQDPTIPAHLVTREAVPVMLNCGHAGDYSLFELQLVLERGLLAMEDGGLRWRIREAIPSPQFSGYRTPSAGELVAGQYLQAMSNAAINIYDAVIRGAPLASTGDTALAAQRLCEQIRRQAARPESRKSK